MVALDGGTDVADDGRLGNCRSLDRRRRRNGCGVAASEEVSALHQPGMGFAHARLFSFLKGGLDYYIFCL